MVFLFTAVGEAPIPTLVPSPTPCIARAGEPPVLFETLSGHLLSATGVSFSPDGKLVASWSYDGTVRLWEVITGNEVEVLGKEFGDPNEAYKHEVIDARFSGDGRQVFSISTDRSFQVYDVDGGGVVSSSRGNWNLWDAKISPDGRQIAVARSSSIWSVAGPKLLGDFQAPNQSGVQVAYSPHAPLLAALIRNPSTSEPQSIIVLDSNLGSEMRRLKVMPGMAALTFSRDGKLLAAAGDKAEVWDTSTWQIVASFGQVKSTGLDISPDDTTLATGNYNYTQLLDIHNQCSITRLGPPAYGVNALAFSPDGLLLALAAGKDVQIWRVPKIVSARSPAGQKKKGVEFDAPLSP